MAHFLPPELVRQVNKLEWPEGLKTVPSRSAHQSQAPNTVLERDQSKNLIKTLQLHAVNCGNVLNMLNLLLLDTGKSNLIF